MIVNDFERRKAILQTKHYYYNDNDIRKKGILPKDTDPVRNADNRISHNFHQILVDEKAAYMFTYPVQFSVQADGISKSKKTDIEKIITQTLGDDFESTSIDLCIEASNTAVAWLHYWIDDETKEFNYAVIDTEQLIPIFNDDIKRKLVGMLRYYEVYDHDTKKWSTIAECWDELSCTTYQFNGRAQTGMRCVSEDTFNHTLGGVPFIEFRNNNRMQSDLHRYKDLIDLYDKVVSGYANDLEDIQQLIYIIENYGGADLNEFLSDLRRYKAIKVESDGNSSGSVNTMQIEIPVEARNKLLELVKKQIYESGQGLQQDTESVGNASGVALKFFYRKLELKAGLTETQFKKGFNKLIRIILKHNKISDDLKIVQTFTRNMISNDLENAQIAQTSVGIIPEKLIIRNHPWVENPEEAEEMMEEEQTKTDPYRNFKPPVGDEDE